MAKKKKENNDMLLPPELIDINSITEHPRNYRIHVEEQLAHIKASMESVGIYRNVVISKDNVLLAGHGVVKAARDKGATKIYATRVNALSTDTEALKVLTGDNESQKLADQNDRMLTEILKEIKDTDDLIGTGFDESKLAALLYVTRPASEIQSFDEAAEWVGMPEYENGNIPVSSLIIHFETDEAKAEFFKMIGLKLSDKVKSTWYPVRDREDLGKVKFE